MNKEKFMAATTASALIILLAAGMQATLVKANFIVRCPEFVVNSDGTITPPTELIGRSGGTYYLTSDTASCSFTIQCSNIEFDGQGHIIDGSVAGFGYSNKGLCLDGVNNVTVKNVTVQGFWDDNIALIDCFNCVLLGVHTKGSSPQPLRLYDSCNNTIAQSSTSNLDLTIGSNSNLVIRNQLEVLYTSGCQNTIYGNNVTRYFFPERGYDNLFYGNNFYHIKNLNMKANRWDNGSVGNYWFDYSTKYPNATEIGNTSIGNTPYVIDANNIDHYPFMAPVNDSVIAPDPTPTPTPTPVIPEFSSWTILLFPMATAAGALLLAKRKRR